MYDLTRFTLRDMVECGLALHQMGDGATSMEQTSQRIVKYLYENLLDQQTGEASCALVRFFKTHPDEELELELKEYTRCMLGEDNPSPGMKCLTLLATVGGKPQWNNRGASVGHKAIALKSEDLVAQTPMISQLIRQFGLNISTVLQPDPDLLLELEQKTFNVFYVPDAIASPHIPAQDSFVIPCGIKSGQIMSKSVILCVDDEPTVLQSLKTQLKSAFKDNYFYEVAEDADEALELISEFSQEKVNIIMIVSDWLMPGMKGDEFLIRVHEICPKIIKIMLTGQADISAIERAKEQADLYDWLPKPWPEEELITTIQSALAKS